MSEILSRESAYELEVKPAFDSLLCVLHGPLSSPPCHLRRRVTCWTKWYLDSCHFDAPRASFSVCGSPTLPSRPILRALRTYFLPRASRFYPGAFFKRSSFLPWFVVLCVLRKWTRGLSAGSSEPLASQKPSPDRPKKTAGHFDIYSQIQSDMMCFPCGKAIAIRAWTIWANTMANVACLKLAVLIFETSRSFGTFSCSMTDYKYNRYVYRHNQLRPPDATVSPPPSWWWFRQVLGAVRRHLCGDCWELSNPFSRLCGRSGTFVVRSFGEG